MFCLCGLCVFPVTSHKLILRWLLLVAPAVLPPAVWGAEGPSHNERRRQSAL